MPLLFRTVKSVDYIPPEHQSNSDDTQKTRKVVFSNERVFDVSPDDVNTINHVSSVLVNAERCICTCEHLFVSVFEIELGSRLRVDSEVKTLFFNKGQTLNASPYAYQSSYNVIEECIAAKEYSITIDSEVYKFSDPNTLSQATIYGGANADMFFACNVAFECQTGSNRKAFYLSSVKQTDYYYSASGKLHVQYDNSLIGYRLKNFSDYMSLVLPLMKGYFMDEHGYLRQGSELTGKIFLSGISDLRMMRRKELKRTISEQTFDNTFVDCVSSYCELMKLVEKQSCYHKHCMYYNNWDEHYLLGVASFCGNFSKFLKLSCVDDFSIAKNDSYLETFPFSESKSPLGLKHTPNNDSIIETVDKYVSFWGYLEEAGETPFYTELSAWRYTVYPGPFPAGGHARNKYGPLYQYDSSSGPNGTYYGAQDVELKLQSIVKRYLVTLENTVRFSKLFSLVEKFFTRKQVLNSNVVSGIQSKFNIYGNTSSLLARTGNNMSQYLREGGGYREEEMSDFYQRFNSNQFAPQWVYYNPPGFCTLPINNYMPQVTEPTTQVFTSDRVSKPGTACDKDIKFQTGLIQGGEKDVLIKDGKTFVNNSIGQIYHTNGCEDSARVDTSKTIQPGISLRNLSPILLLADAL